MDKGKTRALILAASVAVLLLLRIPALRVSQGALFAARIALAMAMGLICKGPGWFWPFAQAVGLALIAWLVDLNEGAMAFVYGAAGLTMAWCIRRFGRLGALPGTLLAALAVCLTAGLGATLVLTLGRARMTPGSALLYALARQIAPFIAYWAGLYLARRLGWGPSAA